MVGKLKHQFSRDKGTNRCEVDRNSFINIPTIGEVEDCMAKSNTGKEDKPDSKLVESPRMLSSSQSAKN